MLAAFFFFQVIEVQIVTLEQTQKQYDSSRYILKHTLTCNKFHLALGSQLKMEKEHIRFNLISWLLN